MRSQQTLVSEAPWLEDAINTTNWSDVEVMMNDPIAVVDPSASLSLSGLVDDGGLVDKVNEHKLAHDVDDLSAIFAQLEEGDVDFSLPCDEDEDDEVGREHDASTEAAEAEHDDWIEDLDRDVVNVEELSAAFDLLAEQVENAEMEDVSETSDASDEEDSEDDDNASVRIVPTAPAWVAAAPLDPRSVIRSTIFKGLDPRIPSVNIPRMDLGFGNTSGASRCPGACGPMMAGAVARPSIAPTSSLKKDDEFEYKHDPATCWICKSDKTAFKKFALHRYLEKRRRRNWKRGPRYSGRSHVATSRVREGGRFVCTARWI